MSAKHRAELLRRISALSPAQRRRLRALAAEELELARDSRALERLLTELVWVDADLPARGTVHGRWLVLADSTGLGDEVASCLKERGAQVTVVYAAPGAAAATGEREVVDATDYQQVAGVWERFESAGAPGHIVHLWGIDSAGREPGIAFSPAEPERTCIGLLYLIQAVARSMDGGAPPRLYLVTCGVHAGSLGEAGLAQAPLWGIGRTARLEHPDLWGGLIDVDRVQDAKEAGERIVSELAEGPSLEQVSYRGAHRRRLRLRAARQLGEAVARHPVREGASYLVTGGLGGLGLDVARWLIDQGARDLVLMTRRGAHTEHQQQVLAELTARGADVWAARGDVAERGDIDRIIETIARDRAPLRGVVHAAGALDDGVLANQTSEQFLRPLRPKVRGGWNLHAATSTLELDLFVLFSSGSSMLGSGGQANYAAGNAFIDALAHYRRGLGLSALSLNWGPWGTGTSVDVIERWAPRGVTPIGVSEAIALLDRLVQRPAGAQYGIVRADWSKYARSSPVDRETLLRSLVAEHSGPAAATPSATASAGGPLAQLQQALPSERRRLLLEHITGIVAQVLGRERAEVADPQRPLLSFGVDSLIAVELRNRLGHSLGSVLPVTLVFDYPNLDAIADYLLKEVLVLEEAPASVERSRVAQVAKQRAHGLDPIAVLGVGCRLAGAAGASQLWSLLRAGKDCVDVVPQDRWDVDKHTIGAADGTRFGSFIDGIDRFDATFFEIAPIEARFLDPQQRLLLEVTWEALEHAALSPSSLRGTRGGVFTAIYFRDYNEIVSHLGSRSADAFAGLGTVNSLASGRISYFLGLHGPAISVDTACSSSLVSVHLACQSLRDRECDLALAGGVGANLTPTTPLVLSKAQGLAPDGRCKTFDQRADGLARGEGCGMVVLKRLDDALRDGDPVLAVVLGTALNQDGRTSGQSVPNGVAQQDVITAALRDAELSARQVDYVEAHGTGTSLGDPIEAGALGQVHRARSADRTRVAVGSLKTNFGHLEPSAGISGLIKVALMMQSEEIPPHLHLSEPNRHIALEQAPALVPTRQTPWVDADRPRVAGVSAFGLSGTNAHMIVAQPPEVAARRGALERRPRSVFVLSAKSAAALDALAESYQRLLAKGTAATLTEICHTASAGRAHFAHRAALICSSKADLAKRLGELRAAKQSAAVRVGEHWGAAPRLAALFTGQGSEYVGMGRELYAGASVFRETLDRCSELLEPELGRPLLPIIFGEADSELLQRPRFMQPALFSIECALHALWRSWGVEPEVVMGHSIGELSAAHAAQIFSLEDGLKLVAARGRALEALPSRGRMAVVFAEEKEVLPVLASFPDVDVASVNTPESVVISGEGDQVEACRKQLGERKILVRVLDLKGAGHSAMLDPILGSFAEVAGTIDYRRPSLTFVSGLSGKVVHDEVAQADYWVRQLRHAVRFMEGVKVLAELDVELFLEIGPMPNLSWMGVQCLPETRGRWFPTLAKGRPDWLQVLESVADLYIHAAELDWERFDSEQSVARRHSLPSYRFQRRRYWADEARQAMEASYERDVARGDSDAGLSVAETEASATGHPLLGRALRTAVPIREGQVDLDRLRYLGHHRVFGLVVFPIAAYLEMAAATALADPGGGDGVAVEDFTIEAPLLLSESGARTIQLLLGSDGGGRRRFSIHSQPDATSSWQAHASGKLARCGPRLPAAESYSPEVIEQIRSRCALHVTQQAHYASCAELGAEFGELFQGLVEAWVSEGEGLGRVRLPEALVEGSSAYVVHPVLLDACLQVLAALQARRGIEDPYMPLALERISFAAERIEPAWCHVKVRPGEGLADTLIADFWMLDEQGSLVAQVEGFATRKASLDALQSAARRQLLDDWIYEVDWIEQPQAHPSARSDDGWLLLYDGPGGHDVARAVSDELLSRGQRCTIVRGGEQHARQADGSVAVPLEPVDPLARLIRDQGKLAGIVYLWGEPPAARSDREPSPLESQPRQCKALLATIQAMLQAELSPSTRLYTVTRGALAVRPGDVVDVAQGTVTGIGRTFNTEYPEVGCTHIDLSAASEISAAEAGAVTSELLASAGETEVAFRDGARYVARLARDTSLAQITPELPLPAGEAYMIVGGLSGLGLLFCHWLVDCGARHLLLMGRSRPDAPTTAALQALEQRGAKIIVHSGDVSKPEDVGAALSRIEAAFGRLDGIIHSAAVLDDAVLTGQSWTRFERVFAAKVNGSWHLHRATAGRSLRFFLMFSGLSGLVGNAGQAGYAAACTFQDALAHYRRSQGLTAHSIDWGLWTGGSARAEALADEFRRRGFGSITASEGTKIAEHIISSSHAQLAVSPFDWPRFSSTHEAGGRPIFSAFTQRQLGERPTAAEADPAQELRRALEQADPRRRRQLLQTFVQQQVAQALGLDDPEELSIDRPLMDMGVNSLIALRLRKSLDIGLDQPPPATLIFKYPTVDAIAGYLDAALGGSATRQGARDGVDGSSAVDAEIEDAVGQMTDDEAEQALADELAALADETSFDDTDSD